MASQAPRLFLALPLPGGARERLAGLRRELDSPALGARWIPAENLHCTLHFLGPTPAGLLKDLHHDLGACAHALRAFDTDLGGLGAFPSFDKPRTLWAGLRDPHGLLRGLFDETSRALARLPRLQPGRGDFIPHVTLARLRPDPAFQSGPLRALLPQWKALGTLTVEKFVLYESRVDPRGAESPRYEVVEEFRLQRRR